MQKIILFDLDGTLIDSTKSILDGFKHAFTVHDGYYPGDDKVLNLIGHPLEFMFKNLGVNKDMVDNFVLSYKKHYKSTYLNTTTLLPAAREAILEANKFAILGVVTTKTSLYSKILLDELSVGEYFKVIIGRDDVTFPKPNAEPIKKALSFIDQNISKNDIFMIGDTIMDLEAAKNANVNGIGLTCGYGKFDDLKNYSSNIFKTPLEAVLYIKNL
ncbi:HAD family hydrolase [Campylobacter ureolyticus]|uniref:HAD family hydrolase n=1 Tax=Campylobacter ureolyticus TaxID=827 RepID=UPI0026F0072B|nr:HAD family hydrolase [Campylobacter ureolyticus]